MFDVATILAAVTPYDWANIDLSAITDVANNVANAAIPVILTITALPVGVKLVKRFISKV